MRHYRLRKTLQWVFDSHTTGERVADCFIGLIGNQYFACCGFPLKSGSNIDRVAHHCVISAVCRTHVGCERRSGRNPNTHGKADTIVQLCIDALYSIFDAEGRANGTKHVIVMLNRYIEERHDCVTEEMIDDSMVLSDDFRADLEERFRD